MCLLTLQKKPYITKVDLKTYKIVVSIFDGTMRNMCGWLKPFIYKFDKLYHTQIIKVDDDTHFDDVEYKYLGKFKQADLVSYGPGFHSMTKKRITNYYLNHDQFIVECLIPKGSEFYRSGNGLLISNQIIIKKLFKNESYKVSKKA